MPLIKIDTIDSTNDYLKQLAKASQLENFTIVMANHQTNGKGQMGAKWIAESGKNLTMSILVKEVNIDNQSIFDFNVAVALAVYDALHSLKIPRLNIKWPNDIMADFKKVGGILIENNLKADGSFTSVVGVGLNLNQTNFENLPKATSLHCITNEIYNTEEVALLITACLQNNCKRLANDADGLWKQYHELLFKIGEPVAFENNNGNRFMGIIQEVNRLGQLVVLLEDESIQQYGVKEIQMLY